MNTAEDMSITMALETLIAGLMPAGLSLPRGVNPLIRGVRLDSREVQPGDLFIACFGRNVDGRDYIDGAIAAGAAAVLAAAGGPWQGVSLRGEVPVVAVDGLSCKISEIAGRFHGHPSHALRLIGVTGTNGKTSCTQFLAQTLGALQGHPCGVIGTLGYGPWGHLEPSALTTPDAVHIQSILADMRRRGLDPVLMEVSSVGLHQQRVRALRFDTALFTNLTRDHLDYHGSMEAYAEAKRRLFTQPGLRVVVANLDDPHALYMLDAVSRDVAVLTYSTRNSAASVHALQVDFTREGYHARIRTPLGDGEIGGPLIGQFNFSNVLAVTATLIGHLQPQGRAELDAILSVVSGLRPVTGRMEIIGEPTDVTAIVDYAHTPDGLRSALQAVHEHFSGRLWCVFGCGGNRDKGKRPLMGEIAEELADALVIADDNPRTEQGDDIIQHILSGIRARERVTVIRDRAAAIDHAIRAAAPGDVILVAGKGHENYQDVGGQRMLFSDAAQVRLALRRRAADSGSVSL